jgi:hypothetical protein
MKSFLFAALICLAASVVWAEDDIKQLIFQTKNGNVSFMHADHQAAEKDCATCHPGGKTGKIPGFSKDAAHKFCIDCHKQKGGPTRCAECHEK